MSDTEVRLKVTADTTNARSGMAALSQSFYIAGGAASRFGTATRASFAGIALGAQALAAVKLIEFLVKSSKLFVEYNDTLARTRAILNDSNGVAKGFEGLEEEIRKVGRTTRFTATQVGEAANKLAIAGVNADEMVSDKALESLVKFAIAGGVDIQTATDIGIAGVKAFGMEMDQLTYVSDILTRTFTRANVDIVSLGEGLKFAAPVAHSAGINLEETAAAIGALGNAGLRGTVAGTGLRMAINKLLKPTFDAQRAMDDLGMNVRVLSPAGQAAESALRQVTMQLDRANEETRQLTDEMNILNGAMNDLSIEQKRNSLAIAQIRERAHRQNRELTDRELDQISRLEEGNRALRLSEQELELERSVKAQAHQKAIDSERQLNTSSKDLLRTVEQQTIGITSLGDMLDQLATSGATTTQVLEIFGVRGGTAISSLLAQRESFHELVALNMEAAGATEQYTKSLQQAVEDGGSAKEIFLLFVSALEDVMLKVGEPMIIMLTKLSTALKGPLMDAIEANMPAFKALGEQLYIMFTMFTMLFIDAMPDIIMIVRGLVPVFMMLAMVFRLILAALAPVFQLLAGVMDLLVGIGKLIVGIFTGDIGMIKGGLKQAGSGLLDALIGGGLTVAMMATGGGSAVASGVGKGMIKSAISSGAKKAGQKSAVSIGGQAALGMNTGLGSGTPEFADGGFVNSPTVGLIGEAGPEVVIPLSPSKSDRAGQLMSAAGMGGTNITVGDIVINGAKNVTADEVRQMLHKELPIILMGQSRMGQRGSF